MSGKLPASAFILTVNSAANIPEVPSHEKKLNCFVRSDMESSQADSNPTETKTVIILLLLNSFDFAVVVAVVDDKSSETSEK